MKREALAFFRILPAGAADMGEVTREELRAEGLGLWSLTEPIAEDIGCVFNRPEEISEEYDIPLIEHVERPDEVVTHVRFRESG